MLETGANVNYQNRYSCVAGHDTVLVRDYSPKGKKKALDSLKYVIKKGSYVNFANRVGVIVKKTGLEVQKLVAGLGAL